MDSAINPTRFEWTLIKATPANEHGHLKFTILMLTTARSFNPTRQYYLLFVWHLARYL